MTVWYGPMRREGIIETVSAELDHAYRKHGREQWGRHEFYAILKEEVDELWDAIKSDAHQNDVRSEAIDVMAMCIRYLETGDRYREPAATCESKAQPEQAASNSADTALKAGSA